jgi:hypothetical protein
MLFAAGRVPCTLVADDVAEGFAGTVDGLSVLRRLTAQVRAPKREKLTDSQSSQHQKQCDGFGGLWKSCD